MELQIIIDSLQSLALILLAVSGFFNSKALGLVNKILGRITDIIGRNN